ncbi:hypothetical protein BC936DRAFT_147571 [Jimgerdemannia flammicorona]|uniref:Uncharacterized protein n=1 Tax=Jimgerdemannia flammicorona TaxID=994334 RepID=A0A433DN80_9FUNG|nr:hypothetical protein BC936DRAFT_147571 [Jimgerdemannia flammicorona]
MNQAHRKKPFSNKQKKKQLQEKRAKKLVKDTSRITDYQETKPNAQGHGDPEQGQPADTKALAQEAPKAKHEGNNVVRDTKGVRINRLRSVFEKPTADVIEASRLSSMQPLHRLSQVALETSFTDVYPTVIDFPCRPSWSYDSSKEELEAREQHYFDAWMDEVYRKYPNERLSLFEHNLEVWRQL